MCVGFGAIVTSDMDLYFTKPDKGGNVSHSEILAGLGWKDNGKAYVRRFVRVECADWTIKSFRFDEEGTLPGWAEENRDEIQNRVARLIVRVAKAKAAAEKEPTVSKAGAACDKAGAAYDQAWAAYVKAKAAYVEARGAYVKAWDAHDKAWDTYVKTWAAHDKAEADYDKARAAAYSRHMSKITGYVEAK